MFRSIPRLRWMLTVLLALSAGCLAPGEPQRNEVTLDEDLQQHLEELLALSRQHSVRRNEVDWTQLRATVLDASSQSTDPRRGAIVALLDGLGDGHSFYVPVGGSRTDRIAVFAACEVTRPATPRLPRSIGYVRVPGSSRPPEEDAAEIRRQLEAGERAAVSGWIVDLRGNSGGTMWPMLEGLRPLLGAEPVGYFVFPDGSVEPWLVPGLDAPAAAGIGAGGISPGGRNPRIAVLTDRGTVSAGEAVAVALRHAPGTRSFGEATCGRSSANRPFRLSDGAVLYLTTAYLADRTTRTYHGRIEPDENVPDEAMIRRAVEWLHSGEGVRQ